MKKTGMLILLMFLVTLSAAANAEVNAGSFSVTPFAGGYFFEGNEDLKNTYTLGVRAGYNFTENLGVEGYFHYIPTEVNGSSDVNVKVFSYGVEGLYHFMPQKRFVPFAAVGIGGFRYTSSGNTEDFDKLTLDYGAGVKYFIKDNIALRADIRHVLPLNDRYNDLLATIGVTFAFGGKQKDVAPAVIEEPPAPKAPEANAEKSPAPAPAPVAVTVPAPAPAPAPIPSPAPPPVAPEKPVVKEKVTITLNIEFDTAKAVIKKKYEADIKKVADFMKVHPETNVVVEGHTDNVDRHHDPSRNIKLSQARADNVRKYLIEQFGIDASRVSAVGYGPEKPVAGNDTKEGRKKNRRIEAVIEAVEAK